MEEFRERVLNNDFHIVAVTETLARGEVDDAELSIDGYTVYRKDSKSDIYKKVEVSLSMLKTLWSLFH